MSKSDVEMNYLEIEGEGYYKISNSDELRPFFMSIVSDSNHWMFISSNGGLTAGRKNNVHALFPYYTDDKITESFEITGSKAIFVIDTSSGREIWEPFSDRYTGVYSYSRNLYKNEYGNKIIFEEINHDLELIYQCHWNSSNTYGFVKKSSLINTSKKAQKVTVLDGIQNIMPYGVDPNLQQSASNLVDAYKKNELLKPSGLGIFALSAMIVDRAEPSEALKANIVWSFGLEQPKYLLSSLQLDWFRKHGDIEQEDDIRAEKGAYFVMSNFQLGAGVSKDWFIIADVSKGPSDVVNISEEILKSQNIKSKVLDDIELGTKNLISLTSAADGLQCTSDQRRNTRHYSNVLFNIMRGGIFDDNYKIEKSDFTKYLGKANKIVYKSNRRVLEKLPKVFNLGLIKELSKKSSDKDFARLCMEYLPLKFSRRHGDPSRPWNKFSINTRSEIDGSKILDYQGNWRDIFQNWEALAHSYPEFMENMIHKFLNATTFDGYNPYRITKDGFDWETIEPDDPWSYIGYWGDHQIIYLLKFLEFIEKHYPKTLEKYFKEDVFVYANVPYIIKDYKNILENSKDTITFDRELDQEIRKKRAILGADGALLDNGNGQIYKVNLIEKLLATLLAKCANLIPGGGIWMNTQRPEWNDANNALVGNGVSMVTLYYMRRFFTFFDTLVSNSALDTVEVSAELKPLFKTVAEVFENAEQYISQGFSDTNRKVVMDRLGIAVSNYRFNIYKNGFSFNKDSIAKGELQHFIKKTLEVLDYTISVNKRTDGLYHGYNLIVVERDGKVSISYLSEMLEGQVAVLSSGYLSPKESLSVLDSLKRSALFREDQYSYILYPNKQLPRFTERNNIPSQAVNNSKLLQSLLQNGNRQIIEQDDIGGYHFNGSFNNDGSLKAALEGLPYSYDKMVKDEMPQLLQVFEDVFNHKAFTGRSGTFYGYEGLGSIYWHMVSKLLLAVQECCLMAIDQKESKEIIGRLLEHYYEINAGIGVHKSPELYGAFPTDPYSHTPGGKGAQQPGMTGQVKEDVLSRFGELGVFVQNGQLYFAPRLLLKDEFLNAPKIFTYKSLDGKTEQMDLNKGELAFTYCQVPIRYQIKDTTGVTVIFKNGTKYMNSSLLLNREVSAKLFNRTGEIEAIQVVIAK